MLGDHVPVIGVIIKGEGLASEAWHATMVEELAHACVTAGAIPAVVTRVDSQPPDPIVRALRGAGVDGLVVSTGSLGHRWVGDLAAAPIPTVLIGREDRLDLPYVDTDGENAVRNLIHHLHGLGRRRIGLVTGPVDRVSVVARIEGWRRGLDEVGLMIDEDLLIKGDFTPESGEIAAGKLLAHTPDAVISMSDQMAMGLVKGLVAAGVHVPDDVAVAGADGTLLATDGRAWLTSVAQPYALVAETAVTELLACIDGADPSPSTLLLGDLVVGASTDPRMTN